MLEGGCALEIDTYLPMYLNCRLEGGGWLVIIIIGQPLM